MQSESQSDQILYGPVLDTQNPFNIRARLKNGRFGSHSTTYRLRYLTGSEFSGWGEGETGRYLFGAFSPPWLHASLGIRGRGMGHPKVVICRFQT